MKNWTFCRRCHWQDEQPQDADLLMTRKKHVARLTVCPACGGSLATMFFARRQWMKFGADLLTGIRFVADFDPAHPPRKKEQ